MRQLMEDAVELGLDMLRVHGHIAPTTIYDTADELGLLLMQDFPLQGVQRRQVRPARSGKHNRWSTYSDITRA